MDFSSKLFGWFLEYLLFLRNTTSSIVVGRVPVLYEFYVDHDDTINQALASEEQWEMNGQLGFAEKYCAIEECLFAFVEMF